MFISGKVHDFLNQHQIDYELVSHPYSERSANTTVLACLPIKNMTKAVVLEDRQGYVMAIIPSANKLMIPWINTTLGRRLRFVTEQKLSQLFPDCTNGAVPPLGIAYGISSCWDDELNAVQDLYLEAGNHRELIHIQREQFKELLKGQSHGSISRHLDEGLNPPQAGFLRFG